MTKILVEKAIIDQALEALEEAYAAQFETTWFEIKPEHFTALREALSKPDIEKMTLTQIAARHEQAEQEPVAWMNTNGAVNKLREAGWAMNADPVQQAEQEPVGMLRMGAKQDFVTTKAAEELSSGYDEWHPVYAAPVRTKDLTDDEIQKWIDVLMYDPPEWALRRFARAVIAADRKKNNV